MLAGVTPMSGSGSIPWVVRMFEDDRTLFEHDESAPSPPRIGESTVPAELIRETAMRLKALAKALPYEEYLSIVHRVAQLKWSCRIAPPGDAALGRDRHPLADTPEGVAMEPATQRLWGAVLDYQECMATRNQSRLLVERARAVRSEARDSRRASAANRAQREADADARAALRLALRDFVGPLKARGDSLDGVLRHTGELLDLILISGALRDDQGSLTADVMRLAAEEYCSDRLTRERYRFSRR